MEYKYDTDDIVRNRNDGKVFKVIAPIGVCYYFKPIPDELKILSLGVLSFEKDYELVKI